MALTKADMAERLFEDLGLNKREAKELVEAFFEEIRRNPKTGEEIPISARRVVTFRPGQKLKARVEAYAGSIEQ
jgi:integration host factor subunit alpha